MKTNIPLLFLVTTFAILADGASLYQEKCSVCHGVDGKQKAMRKTNPIANMSEAKIARDLKAYKNGTLNRYGMAGLMRAQVKSYTEEQINMLSKYIPTLAGNKTTKSTLEKSTAK